MSLIEQLTSAGDRHLSDCYATVRTMSGILDYVRGQADGREAIKM